MSTRIKELSKNFEKSKSPKDFVEKTLPKQNDSYLYGGKTVDAQKTTTPLVVLARPGAYDMVCNNDACYIRIPHNAGQIPSAKIPNPPPSITNSTTSQRRPPSVAVSVSSYEERNQSYKKKYSY